MKEKPIDAIVFTEESWKTGLYECYSTHCNSKMIEVLVSKSTSLCAIIYGHLPWKHFVEKSELYLMPKQKILWRNWNDTVYPEGVAYDTLRLADQRKAIQRTHVTKEVINSEGKIISIHIVDRSITNS